MKVLIADDSKFQRQVLKNVIADGGYEVIEASTGEEAHEVLRSGDEIPICLLDWQMPELSGIDLAKMIRSKANTPYKYLILVTASGTQSHLQEGFSAGVDDFVRKPFDPCEVLARVRAGERIVKLESELRATAAALQFQADHDGLTKLLNRSAVMSGLEREFLRARRTHSELSIVLGDIDHFKGINDTYGHSEGDRVITSVASAIRDSIRPYDLAGRYGGEEFLIVLPGCSEIAATEKADRLKYLIQERNEDQTTVTMSFGVCDLRPEMITIHDLLCAADSLLYTAKRAGRNRVEPRVPSVKNETLETNQRLAVVLEWHLHSRSESDREPLPPY